MEGDSLLNGISLPYFKVNTQNIYNEIVKCYLYSERIGTPIAILVDASQMNTIVEYERRNNLQKSFLYERSILKHVVHPLFADYQYKLFTARKHKVDSSKFTPPEIPVIPQELPDRYKDAVSKYQPFFDIFKQFKTGIVCGDTSASSSYCLPPYNCIDIVTYIGGSIPLAIGAFMAGNKHSWALTGDFGFISAGHIGLLEASNRGIPIKVIIFNNKKAAATGGQKIDKKLLLRLISPYERNTKHIHNAEDPLEINEVLDEAITADELRIIVVNY
jgi:hypothetical protein